MSAQIAPIPQVKNDSAGTPQTAVPAYLLGNLESSETETGQAGAGFLWWMADKAGEWLPDKNVGWCGKAVDSAEAKAGMGATTGWTIHKRAGLTDVVWCNEYHHCPKCARRVAEVRREELGGAVDRHVERGGGLLLLTQTLPHGSTETLLGVKARFRDAAHRLSNDREWKALCTEYGIEHRVKALDFTVGEMNGWHPNDHILCFTTPGGRIATADPLDYDALQAEFWNRGFPRWLYVCVKAGMPEPTGLALEAFERHGLKVQIGYKGIAEYVAKYGYEKQGHWDVASEVARAASKMAHKEHYTVLGLLADVRAHPDHEERNRAWFVEAAAALFDTRLLVWSKGAKKALGVAQKEKKVGERQPREPEPDYYEETYQSTDAEWYALKRAQLIGRWIDAAREEGMPGASRVPTEAVATLKLIDREYMELGLDGRWRFIAHVQHPGLAPPTKIRDRDNVVTYEGGF